MADSWAPAWDQDVESAASRVVVAQVNDEALDLVLRQGMIPYAVNPLAQWLLDDAGVQVPPPPVRIYPPSSGRGHPCTIT